MTATAIEKLTTPQLIILRSLRKKGWSAELACWCWSRAGGSKAEFAAMHLAGLIEERDGRWHLTAAGKKEFKRQAQGRWF